MTTIYEVAALAGVSTATVSRVMNGRPVKPSSEERVRAAVTELSYTPSRPARSLRRNHTQVIALIIPDIENPFFTALARGAEDVARAAGYSLVLCNTDDDSEREATYVGIVRSEQMAGAIIAPAFEGASLSILLERNRPIVSVDRKVPNLHIDAVVADNAAGAAEATKWIYDNGFERVACITGPRHVETAQQRSAGWREVSRLRSSRLDDYLRWADYRVAGGRTAMRELLALDTPPDSVVVANNLMAIGALDSLHEAGLDACAFGFAVFGDLPFASVSQAGVHVVPLPAREIGTAAARLLLSRINGEDAPRQILVIGSDGRVRATSLESGLSAAPTLHFDL